MIEAKALPFLMAFSIAASANAIEFDMYDQLKKTERFREQIAGVGRGYFWANAELQYRNQPVLYCQPGKLTLDTDNYLRLLDDYIDERKAIGRNFSGFPLEAILLLALQNAFPCK